MKMVKKDNIIKGFQEVITDITKNGDDCAILYLDRETNNTYHFGSQCGLNFLAKNSDISQRFLCSCYGMLMVAIGQPGNVPSQPGNIPSQPLPPVTGVFRVSNTEHVENQQYQTQQVLPSQHLVTDHDQMDQNADVNMQQSETPLEADPQTDDTSQPEKVPQTEQSPISEPQTEQVQQPEQLLQEGIKTEPVEQYEEAMQEEFQSEHAQQLEETPQEGQQNEQKQQIKVNRDSSGRFHHVTLEEISHYHDSNDQSRSTKFNTRWSTKIIQAMFESDLESDDQVDGTAEQPAPVPCYQEAEAGGSTSRPRFQIVTDDQIKEYEEAHHSEKTRLNTKWVVRLFQEWHVSEYQISMDFETISENDLSWKLHKFYCEAKSKTGEHYHNNSLKNIRAGLNRHLSDIGREIDIVRDVEFKSANIVLDGRLKEMVNAGLSKPTKHKAIIEPYDLHRINQYFQDAESNPVILRQAVWYNLSIHFLSRGLEFLRQLLKTSLHFKTDDNGAEYVTICKEYQQKHFQRVLHSNEILTDKRMYATGQSSCPVRLLRMFLDKTDDDAIYLFNTCTQDAVTNPMQISIWFSAKHLSKRVFFGFMPDISKSSGCSQRYTAHSLRNTTFIAISNPGNEYRHIMFMPQQRNESSLKS